MATKIAFQDDHSTAQSREAILIVAFRAGYPTQGVYCPGFEGGHFCVNPLYKGRSGEVRLSTCSVGGVVSPAQMATLVSGEATWLVQGTWTIRLATEVPTAEVIGEAHDAYFAHHWCPEEDEDAVA